MSYVASVMIIFTVAEESWEKDNGEMVYPRINEVNAWLAQHRFPPLLDIDQHAGGNKRMQINVWGGAFNYLDLEQFITEGVLARDWEEPKHVTVIWNDEHDEGVTVRTVWDMREARSQGAASVLLKGAGEG
jgi:hypothetical protein